MVIVDGKVYQIGSLYQCEVGEVGRLEKVDQTKNYPFILKITNENGTVTKPKKRIYAIEYNFGTIEDAPVELENGEWYMCKADSVEMVFLWNHAFWYDQGSKEEAFNDYTDIKPLYKMVRG